MAVLSLESPDHLKHAPVERCCRKISEFADQHEAGASFDDRHDRVAAGTVDCVDLPVSELAPFVRRCSTLGDVPLASNPAATLLCRVPLPPAPGALPQTQVERASSVFIGPNVLINCLMAYPELPGATQFAADLIGTQTFAQQILGQHPLLACELAPVACP